MLYRVEHLRGYTIRAIDGDVGTVDDILFDDRGWVVRYVVADTGGWLSSRRVLLSPSILDRPDRMALALPVRLTREKVRESPRIDADAPVTREQEELLSRHYGWAAWWSEPATSVGLLGTGPLNEPPLTAAPINPATPPPDSEAARAEASLRSAHEITGFKIATADGVL